MEVEELEGDVDLLYESEDEMEDVWVMFWVSRFIVKLMEIRYLD